MCGIAGFVDFKKKCDQQQLMRMTDCVAYRGPDASGYEFIEHDNCVIGLGHRRLSIIDLSPLGSQPMHSPDKDAVIIFNGEIYNYAEVRQDLIQLGYSFKSNSDTEVMLRAYLHWGPDAVHKFIGMFVFIIYDKRTEKVLLFRDRAGVKPLYYYWKDDTFLFASELKSFYHIPAFKKELDQNSVYEFIQYSYVPAPNSIFKNTAKVEPGTFVTIDLRNKSIRHTRYWNVIDHYKKPVLKISEEDAREELEARLRKACDYRMVADVPVGLFLSGGYDSSLVAAMLQTGRTEKIKTYTIGFPDQKYDEAVHAKKVASHLGTDHHELYCTYDEAKSIIPDLPYFYDEPFGDSSAIPSILVSRFARESVTVALSADGGDELFAGYTRHASLMQLVEKAKNSSVVKNQVLAFALGNTPEFVMKKIARGKNVSSGNRDKYAAFLKGKIDLVDMIDFANQSTWPGTLDKLMNIRHAKREFFHKDEIREIEGDLSQLLAFDYVSYLPNDILTKVDRATMSTSLEGREPLLDQNIIEWVATLPAYYKLKNNRSKYLLRSIVHKYIPASIMERPKMGFTVPLVEWFRKDLKYLFDEHLNQSSLAKHGLINHDHLQQELNTYYKGNDFGFPLLWNVLMFQQWFNTWMK